MVGCKVAANTTEAHTSLVPSHPAIGRRGLLWILTISRMLMRRKRREWWKRIAEYAGD